MHRSRFLAAISAVVCSAGCNDVPSAQNYATVFGRVYDATSNAGISGVQIAADTVLVAVTAADGTFVIAPVPSGQTDVLVTPPDGYSLAAQPAAFSVNNGDHFRLDVALDRG
jgi:hypothetical protein